jgi:hypothetical protein
MMPQDNEEVKGAETKALWALILAIADFVICGILCIPALILANQALAVLDRPGVQSTSRGMASAAKVMAIIGIVLLILGVIGGIIWVIFVAGMAGMGAATSGGSP